MTDAATCLNATSVPHVHAEWTPEPYAASLCMKTKITWSL